MSLCWQIPNKVMIVWGFVSDIWKLCFCVVVIYSVASTNSFHLKSDNMIWSRCIMITIKISLNMWLSPNKSSDDEIKQGQRQWCLDGVVNWKLWKVFGCTPSLRNKYSILKKYQLVWEIVFQTYGTKMGDEVEVINDDYDNDDVAVVVQEEAAMSERDKFLFDNLVHWWHISRGKLKLLQTGLVSIH